MLRKSENIFEITPKIKILLDLTILLITKILKSYNPTEMKTNW